MFDLYNVFNQNTAVQEELGYSAATTGAGSLWSPQVIMPGRLAKFAFQVDF